MKEDFRSRVQAKLQATGNTGRSDLELHDAKVIEAGNAVRVLATYAEFFGPPSVHDIQAWLQKRMGDFGNQVSARLDTVKAYPQQNFVTFIVEQKKLRQPLAASSQMYKAGPDLWQDNDNNLWKVVRGEGPAYLIRKEPTDIEEMMAIRREALKGGASHRRNVTLAAVDSIPSAGGGFASVDVGDVVDFYFNGQIHRGKLESAGASGVRIKHLTSGETYTVDPQAITTVVEKSAGAQKEQDDVMRRYYSLVYPGNPAMVEKISPTSNRQIQDNRTGPAPGGEPVQPIEVAASTRRVSGSARVGRVTAKGGGFHVYTEDGFESAHDTESAAKKAAIALSKKFKGMPAMVVETNWEGLTGGGKGQEVAWVQGGREVKKGDFVRGSARPFGKASK